MSETRSRFVAEASHELRTPLAVIREFIALVHDGIVGPVTPRQQECLQSAIRNCDRITALIDNMLDLARIESGKQELRRVKADLRPLLIECHGDFRPKCDAKKQSLLLTLPDKMPAAHVDLPSIHNILVNLLGNAHKFTPEGGAIRLGCAVEGRYVSVVVEDNGPGIPPEEQERVFEPFYQVNRQDGPGAKGTGLGLAIVKNLAQINGGYVSLERAPGKGSRFSVALPIYTEAPVHRILVIDDDDAALKIIARMLAHSGLNLEVRSAHGGMEALITAGEFHPHLVILDVHIGDVDGQQVLASLKETTETHAGKVLMISGDAEALAKTRKADAHLNKPFQARDLIRNVVSLLGIERMAR
ncbi:MAG: ATP-binding protein [Verrucomicrobiota bacterium]|nr:ATP-binding protein [Verrucomicrobiota bacterium]